MEFRVWCKNKREWEKDTVFLGSNGIMYQLDRHNNPTALSGNSHILSRSTGLRDKNGEEIFEDDIIVVGEDDGNPSFRYVVQWVDGSACFLARQNKTSGSYIGTGYGRKDWLVVGNIHDNPGLLESEEKQ